MKRILAAVLAVLLAFSLSGCGGFVSIMPGTELATPSAEDNAAAPEEAAFEEIGLLSFLGWETFRDSYYSDTPAALSYQTEAGEGGVRGCRAYVFDRASIIAACDALRGMTVTGKAPETGAPGAEYTLTMPDGREYAVSFGVLPDGARVLHDITGSYAVTGGDALWDIAFPAYSGSFDVFDLYFDDSVRAFADGFYEDTPVSVGYRLSSGATITSEDPAAVEAAFRALSGATVTVVENRPDQNIDLTDTRDYIFTMADGSYRTFSFAQQCLAVTANTSFGTVYYWLDGIGALWDVEIVSADPNGAFEGGLVAYLREDIGTAAAAATGERQDLTVAGVFVEYIIGEEGAYLTLSGDLADEFIREMASIEATGETADAPGGDRITVSVTLSDLSGPIIYFNGDTVQQTVGVNYVCDSGDMAAFRQYILNLAAEGNNEAEIAEGTND